MNTRIKELRELNKLKQSQLALLTGIDQRTISNYETGKTYPDAKALIVLSDYFKVSIDYLLFRTDKNTYDTAETDRYIDEIIGQLKRLKSKQ